MPCVSRWWVPTPSPRYSWDCHGPIGVREISPTTQARITSPLSCDAALFQRFAGHHKRSKSAFHVRNAKTLNLVSNDAPRELGIGFGVGDHAKICTGAGEACIRVAVEPETQARAVALENADGVRAVELNVLAYGFQAVGREPGQNVLRYGFLLPRRARNRSKIATDLSQLVAIDLR